MTHCMTEPMILLFNILLFYGYFVAALCIAKKKKPTLIIPMIKSGLLLGILDSE